MVHSISLGKAKVKQFELFKLNPQIGVDISELNPELVKLMNVNTKDAGLKYNTQTKLKKAVIKAVEEFNEQRTKLLEECSIKKLIVLEGSNEEKEVFQKLRDLTEIDEVGIIKTCKVDGESVTKVVLNEYDVRDFKELNTRFNELLNVEIELDCYPISISQLSKHADCSEMDFSALEHFLRDDQ